MNNTMGGTIQRRPNNSGIIVLAVTLVIAFLFVATANASTTMHNSVFAQSNITNSTNNTNVTNASAVPTNQGCGCVPIISVYPSFQDQFSGSPITINSTVVSYGCGCVTSDHYQWYNDTSGTPVAIPGATSLTFTETAGALGNFEYFITINDYWNTNQSNTATVHVCACNQQPPPPVNNPAPTTTNNTNTTGGTKPPSEGIVIINSAGGPPASNGTTTVVTTTVPTTTVPTTTVPITVPPQVPVTNTTSSTNGNQTGQVPPITVSGPTSGNKNEIMANLTGIFTLIGLIIVVLSIVLSNLKLNIIGKTGKKKKN